MPRKKRPTRRVAKPSVPLGTMPLERIEFDRINPAPYNPRVDLKPGDPEYEKLKRSMREFGYVEPLVWNSRSGILVSGHQRMKVLKAEGATAADVVVVDLNPSEEKALNIAMNRIGGDWDADKLGEILNELGTDADFDIALTGLDADEIDEMVKDTIAALDTPDGSKPAAPEKGGRDASKPALGPMEYRIVIDCTGEKQQSKLLARFGKEGLKCRALIS